MRHFPDVDTCFARVAYYGDGLGQPKDGYEPEAFRTAAWHLGHAQADVVCWNGSRGAGFGLDVDERLCSAMTEASGVRTTTTSLATAALLRRLGARRVAFIVPGGPDYAEDAARGLAVELASVRGFGLVDNLAAARVGPDDISAMVRDVARATPDAILIWGTNTPGFEVADSLERELGLPVIDSAAAGVWGCLVALQIDPSPARSWGSIFASGS